MFFGLLTLYSAGQTDVPTRAAGVWYRQFFWFGIGVVAGWAVFHVSLRLLGLELDPGVALTLLHYRVAAGIGVGLLRLLARDAGLQRQERLVGVVVPKRHLPRVHGVLALARQHHVLVLPRRRRGH
jgi:hypothetical protein